MSGILAVLIFILGLVIGSFLNVVIFRFNTGSSWQILNGRSRCLSCNRVLRWYELVPLLSWIFQLGRCRRCWSRISIQYPLVELLTGLIFLGIWLILPLSALTLWYLVSWSLLIVITVYDLRHLIIPDSLVWSFVVISLLISALTGRLVLSLLIAVILAGFFWLLWFVSRGRWLGFGDAKLVFGVGLFLGLPEAISAIILAFWIGAVVGLILIAISRLWSKDQSVTMKSEIPFAPFIILGTILVFFFHLNVLTF